MGRWLKNNRGFIVLVLCFGFFRTAIADWNPIPSSSMRPSLLEGDVVFVDRLAYNVKIPLTDIVLARLAEPKRGDVVTFSSPQDGTRLIKRVIGLPGDVVEMRDEILFINDERAKYAAPEALLEPSETGTPLEALCVTEVIGTSERRIQWLRDAHGRSGFAPITVPPDSYLMLGDNRDNSADSRYFGFVPRHLLIGRATRVLISADIIGNWRPRFDRFGKAL